MIRLLVKDGERFRELEVTEDPITIGRSSKNTLSLQDRKTSRKHARIEKTPEGGYRVVDLKSGNGTLVNGRETSTRVLSKGDEIRMGLATITVLHVDGPEFPAAPPDLPASSAADVHAEAARRAMGGIGRSRIRSGIRTTVAVAFALFVVGVLVVGTVRVAKHYAKPGPEAVSRKPAGPARGPSLQEAEDVYHALEAKAASGPVTDGVIEEASQASRRYRRLYPQASPFDRLVDRLLAGKFEQAKSNVGDVKTAVDAALREGRYGVALEQLQRLKASNDPFVQSEVAALIGKVDGAVGRDFTAVDEAGRRLEKERHYAQAKEHYSRHAPRFLGTEYYARLANKPVILDALAQAVAEAAKSAPVPPRPLETAVALEPEKPPGETAGLPEPPQPMRPPPKLPEPSLPEPPRPPEPPEMRPPTEVPKIDPPKNVRNPCDFKKVVKGVYCLNCDRVLEVFDVRHGVCKRCEEKPRKIDMCVKKYYQADCHPEKVGDKPIT